jgi:hypothetical protein
MKTPALALIAGLALVGCQTQKTDAPAKVVPVQRNLAVGATPESVTKGFGGKYFVTLMGASRKAGDGDGKIVKVDGDKVTVLTEGLDDPKGIVFVANQLITADFDKVWSIDAKGKKTLLAGPDAFPTPPTFLNDVVVSPDKKSVLITDMGAVTKMRGTDGKLFTLSLIHI